MNKSQFWFVYLCGAILGASIMYLMIAFALWRWS